MSRATGVSPRRTIGRLAAGNPSQAAWTQVQLGQDGGHCAQGDSLSPVQCSEQPASSRPATADTSEPAPTSCNTSIRQNTRNIAPAHPARREAKGR